MLLDLRSALEVSETIRRGLAAALETIAGLQVYEFMPGHVVAPATVIRRDFGPRPETFAVARMTVGFIVTLFTPLSDEHLGQKTEFNARTVYDAIDADPTLGGAAEYVDVVGVTADEIVNFGGLSYASTELSVEVSTF